MKRGKIEIKPCTECTVSSNGVFCSVSEKNLGILDQARGSNFYKKGQTIFYEGNHTNGLFCIYSGKVKLSKLGENGKEQIIRFAKTGNILGYRSLLSNDTYHAPATAMEDCHVFLLSKDRFMEILESDPKLSMNIVQLLSNDLKSAEQLLIDIAQKSVIERISESLVLLQKTFGYVNGGKTINVALTRSEIADIAGTTTETTIRTLVQLDKEGIIKLVDKKINILDLQKLIQRAKIYD
jgi:CRP/FNR family transcriptional regulator